MWGMIFLITAVIDYVYVKYTWINHDWYMVWSNCGWVLGALISKYLPSLWRQYNYVKNKPTQKAQSPFLEGNFAPWRSEDNIENIEIIGTIPNDLNGTLLRNGSNPQFDPLGQYHWFEGDGMLHAIQIKDGKASYSNRWIRTEKFKIEKKFGQPLFNTALSNSPDPRLDGISPNTANTNVIAYQEKILALNEGASPVSIEPNSLNTLGDYTFNNAITTSLTAHPRYDHRKKEFLAYSYLNDDGNLYYYRLDENNKLLSKAQINWPYQSMMHDFVITEHYVIFPVFPATMSFERMMNGGKIFMWEGDKYKTCFVITNRNGDEITRIHTDPCFVYHFGNAYEDGDDIIIDAMRGHTCGLMSDRHGKVATRKDSRSHLVRWTLNLKTNSVSCKTIDTQTGEFPRFDERFTGYPYQHLYIGASAHVGDLFDRIVHYDLVNEIKTEHCFENSVPSEPVFVPRSSQEGDGYLLTVVYREAEDRSDVVILDALHINSDPIAIIKIPHRIPFGFHGNFIA
jgi:carotenoid cleavage dioxygenase